MTRNYLVHTSQVAAGDPEQTSAVRDERGLAVYALESDQSLETDDAVMGDTRPRNDCDRHYPDHYWCYLGRTPRQTVLSSGPAHISAPLPAALVCRTTAELLRRTRC